MGTNEKALQRSLESAYDPSPGKLSAAAIIDPNK
jgi:hypothetical protein